MKAPRLHVFPVRSDATTVPMPKLYLLSGKTRLAKLGRLLQALRIAQSGLMPRPLQATIGVCNRALGVNEETPVQKCSIHEDCQLEEDRHRWIESEKAGQDLGEVAVRQWVSQHWSGYLRARWLVSPAAAFITGQTIRVNGGSVRG